MDEEANNPIVTRNDVHGRMSFSSYQSVELNHTMARVFNEQQEFERLKRGRRSFGIFCLVDFLLNFLLYSIYLKAENESYGDMFSDQLTIEKSMADLVLLTIIRDLFLVLVYIILKLRVWFYAGIIAFISTIYIALKIFLFPMSDCPVCYVLVISIFGMGWLSVYLIDFGFKLTTDRDHFFGCCPTRSNRLQNDHHSNAQLPTEPNEHSEGDLGGRVGTWMSTQESSECDFKSVDSVDFPGDLEAIPEEDDQRSKDSRQGSLIDKFGMSSEELLYRAKDYLLFAKAEIRSESMSWKLEECGAFGTSIFSADSAQNSNKLKLLKMEMVLCLAPNSLDALLMQFSPDRELWDDSIANFSLVESIDQSCFIISILLRNIDQSKKKGELDDPINLVMKSELTERGTIHRYGGALSLNPNKPSLASNTPTTPPDKDLPQNFSIYGYTIKPIPSSENKSELLFLLGMKRSTGFFGSASNFKSNIQLLLTLSDSLLAKVKSFNRLSQPTSERSYEASVEYDNLTFENK